MHGRTVGFPRQGTHRPPSSKTSQCHYLSSIQDLLFLQYLHARTTPESAFGRERRCPFFR